MPEELPHIRFLEQEEVQEMNELHLKASDSLPILALKASMTLQALDLRPGSLQARHRRHKDSRPLLAKASSNTVSSSRA